MHSLVARVSLIAAVVLFAAFGVAYLHFPFSGDHGHFATLGRALAGGAMPYRDYWDLNGPAIPALHVVSEWLFGHSMRAIRAFDLLWMAATFYLLHRVGRQTMGPEAAAIGVLLAVVTYFTLGHHATAQRDGFCLAFILAALLPIVQPPRSRGRDVAAAIGVGAAAAAVVALKPPVLLPFALIGPALVFRAREGRMARAAAGIAGFVLPLGVFLFALWMGEALDDFIDSVVRFNSDYARERYGLRAQARLFADYATHYPVLAIGPLAALVGLARPGLRVVAGVTLLCALTVSIQGKLTGYQLMPTTLLSALWSGFAIASAFGASRGRILLRAAAAVALGAIAWTAVQNARVHDITAIWSALQRGDTVRVQREEMALANFVARHSKPDDTVLVWGFGTSGIVHFVSHRAPATRWIANYVFSMDHPDSEMVARWRTEFLQALEQRPPRLVVVVSGDSWRAAGNLDSTVSFERFTALRDFVAAHYEPLAQMGGKLHYQIYRLRDDDAHPQ